MEGKSAGCFDSIIFENDYILRLFTPMCNKSSLHIVKAMNFMLNYNELKRFYPDAQRCPIRIKK
ncbi:hypothetical protein [Kingella denitrificans]|uniref:hypothetical protein n=1 Tax=Kingella denitrificans TaxID=502 RepID=UPI000B99B781|nr:hypothetical protein [Kingella denitrificans]